MVCYVATGDRILMESTLTESMTNQTHLFSQQFMLLGRQFCTSTSVANYLCLLTYTDMQLSGDVLCLEMLLVWNPNFFQN